MADRRRARILAAVCAAAAMLAGVPIQAQDAPPEPIAGEPVTGFGVTETVEQIMDRGALLPPSAMPFREKKEIYGNRDKQPNPLAPLVAEWPPAETAETDGVPPLLS